MRRRHRKKQRVAEFAEMGFEVWVRVDVAVPTRVAPRYEWDRYRADVIALFEDFDAMLEGRGLRSRGSVGASASLIVSAAATRSASEADRVAVGDWLRSHQSVMWFQIGGRVDVNARREFRRDLSSGAIEFDRVAMAAAVFIHCEQERRSDGS